jgi:Serine dehydrogenase proteinase
MEMKYSMEAEIRPEDGAAKQEELLAQAANKVSAKDNADIFFFNSILNPIAVDALIQQVLDHRGKDQHALNNVFLILVTGGGDPNLAFRLARFLQDTYKVFTLCVSGYCKSAGTLVAIGAHEIVFSVFGELGPLDVQLPNAGDWSHSSGLCVANTFTSLQEPMMQCFDKVLSHLSWMRPTLTLKMATEIASSITTGLFSEIYGQIQPLQVGETSRAMEIGLAYGQRLNNHSKNLKDNESLKKLVESYSSHGFVIDKTEASLLFRNVRRTNKLENDLLSILAKDGRYPNSNPDPDIRLLSKYSAKNGNNGNAPNSTEAPRANGIGRSIAPKI